MVATNYEWSYTPQEVTYDSDSEGYVKLESGARDDVVLDDICWRIVSTIESFTPFGERVMDCVGAMLEDRDIDLSELDEIEAEDGPIFFNSEYDLTIQEAVTALSAYKYEAGYHHAVILFLSDLAQSLWWSGIDVLARALRCELDEFDEPEDGPVHSTFNPEHVPSSESAWTQKRPTVLLESKNDE